MGFGCGARGPAVTVSDEGTLNMPRRLIVDSVLGERMSRNVLAIEYRHEKSRGRTPYRHDFKERGVEMYALANGDILIHHESLALHDVFSVPEDE